MKVQNHINSNEPKWYRCKSVEFTEETANWELSKTGEYSLLAAYVKSPHRQLIQATDDHSLRAFVKSWGPLKISLDSWTGSDPITLYRSQRDHFQAWVRLLGAVQNGEALHDAVVGLLLHKDLETLAIPIRHRLGFTAEPVFDETVWMRIASASRDEILWICRFLVGSFPVSPFGHGFAINQTRKGLHLAARMNFLGLMDALHWMVWQDIFMENPFQFCVECGKLIPFTSRHARRFCPDGCAHRRTAREWQQRKRKKERKIDGTQKTR